MTVDTFTDRVRQTEAAEKAAEVHAGQLKFAYQLSAHHPYDLMHVHGLGWHTWEAQPCSGAVRGGRWIKDDKGAAVQAVTVVLKAAIAETIGDKAARKEIERCENASGVNGILSLAANLPLMATTVTGIDPDPYLLNTPSGTLDLRDMRLKTAMPMDRITKITRGAYQPGLRSERWEAFLERVLPDPGVRGFLQRLAGIGLLGVVKEHVLPILNGEGQNGKGTFDRAFAHALGDYAIEGDPDLLMPRPGAHPTGQMDLRGVRWCVVSESDAGRQMAEATMKRLTGGDTIRARAMRQDFVQFAPSHTVILVTNHLPKVSGDDPAVWRRVRVVPFHVVIPAHERDTGLDEAFQLEADAILTWAVDGYRDYVARGGLGERQDVLAATATYKADNDTMARFLAEECVIDPDVYATTTSLHAAFERWARLEKVDPMGSKTFGAALDRLGFATAKSNGRKLRRGVAPIVQTGEESLT